MLRFLGFGSGKSKDKMTRTSGGESQWAHDKLKELTRDEKIALTAGSDSWRTVAIPEKGIPYIKLTDGPAGARGGGGFKDSTPSTLFPSPSCLGATWDIALAHDMGRFIGLDAHEKLCHVVLGPTINIQRDPRAGRYFESYSEDPHLSGRLGCAWVAGAQDSVEGMAATMKHLVGNEAETDRRFSSSDVSKEALREVYLEPFREIMAGLQRQGHKAYDGQPGCVMVAYNRVNGVSASENQETVNEILRKEWGFKGLVTSDWFSLHAPGLGVTDLEMPGPALHRKMPELLDKIDFNLEENQKALDRCALKILDIVHKVGKLGYNESPEKEVEKSVDVNKVGPTIRRIGAEGAVLLKNNADVLPIIPKKGLRIACIGKPWVDAVQSGGGSADLTPQKVVEPLATLKKAVGGKGVEISHHYGCDISNFLPIIPSKTQITYFSGRTPGQGDVIGEQHVETSRISLWHPKPSGTEANNWWLRATVQVPPCQVAGTHRFGFNSLGNMNISATSKTGGRQVWRYEGETNIFEYSMNPARVWGKYEMTLEKDEPVQITLDYVPIILDDTVKHSLAGAFEASFQLEKDEDQDIRDAASVAGNADIAIVLTALGKDWESEGFDRPDMRLPRKQDELVKSIAKAQPKTAILNITGSAIEMPWYEDVSAVVQAWYGGQEGGEAIVDVLLARGEAPASGRLGSTWPKKLADHPSGRDESTFPGIKGEGGPHVTYNEGRLIGHRWYNTRKEAEKPAHYLGSGIGGYTTFATSLKKVTGEHSLTGSSAKLSVVVSTKNTGQRSGKDVAQIYLRRKNRCTLQGHNEDAGQEEPLQKLVGFATLYAKPGKNTEATIDLFQDAFSFWNEEDRQWRVHAGEYDVVLARSADVDDTLAIHTVNIKNGWTWEGTGV